MHVWFNGADIKGNAVIWVLQKEFRKKCVNQQQRPREDRAILVEQWTPPEAQSNGWKALL